VIQEVGITLDDFFAQQQANSKGLINKRAEGRDHLKQDKEGIETGKLDKTRVTGKGSKLEGKDTYAVVSGEGADFFGFSSKDDDDFGGRSGAAGAGRGDRERRERAPRGQTGGRGRGGRKQGKIQIDDESFPAL